MMRGIMRSFRANDLYGISVREVDKSVRSEWADWKRSLTKALRLL